MAPKYISWSFSPSEKCLQCNWLLRWALCLISHCLSLCQNRVPKLLTAFNPADLPVFPPQSRCCFHVGIPLAVSRTGFCGVSFMPVSHQWWLLPYPDHICLWVPFPCSLSVGNATCYPERGASHLQLPSFVLTNAFNCWRNAPFNLGALLLPAYTFWERVQKGNSVIFVCSTSGAFVDTSIQQNKAVRERSLM